MYCSVIALIISQPHLGGGHLVQFSMIFRTIVFSPRAVCVCTNCTGVLISLHQKRRGTSLCRAHSSLFTGVNKLFLAQTPVCVCFNTDTEFFFWHYLAVPVDMGFTEETRSGLLKTYARATGTKEIKINISEEKICSKSAPFDLYRN